MKTIARTEGKSKHADGCVCTDCLLDDIERYAGRLTEALSSKPRDLDHLFDICESIGQCARFLDKYCSLPGVEVN